MVNRSKTYITIFGKSLRKLEYVEQLNIKWCTSFELLGIQFDQTLDNMECNYDKCLKSMRDELNSLRFRHLNCFGKITVIKAFCLKSLSISS